MLDERLQRAAEAVKSVGCDWAILTNFDSICYALGHVPSIETAISPFAGGPTTAFVRADGVCGLIAPNVESAAAQASRADEKIIYEGFAYDHRADIVGNYTAAIEQMKARLGIGGVFGAEPETLPARLAASLGADQTVDITEPLRRARSTKTAEEKELMERAATAAARGQQAFYEWARPGRTELDVFAQIRAAMENFAGERMAVAGDFLSGKERTAGGVGWPISRVINLNDPLISDLAPRVSGYWGDSCASSVLGTPQDGYLKLFNTAKRALDRALEIMRPGVLAADLDAELRRSVGTAGYSYPHHSGHSIGASVHEWPRLTPYERAPLQEGMFIMVEPAAYDPDIGGVRLEWMIEITATGCRPAAPFEHYASIAA
ncbi:MAG TPA: Xaa-Pro peptidase family protein [Roseiarcus sp.]